MPEIRLQDRDGPSHRDKPQDQSEPEGLMAEIRLQDGDNPTNHRDTPQDLDPQQRQSVHSIDMEDRQDVESQMESSVCLRMKRLTVVISNHSK